MDRTTPAPGLRRLRAAAQDGAFLQPADPRGCPQSRLGPKRIRALSGGTVPVLKRARRHRAPPRRRLSTFSLVRLPVRAALDYRAQLQHLLGALLALHLWRLSFWRQNPVERDRTRLGGGRPHRLESCCGSEPRIIANNLGCFFLSALAFIGVHSR